MRGETTIELDVLVWVGSFALGIVGPHWAWGWSWWVAVPVGIVFGFLLYLPIWFALIAGLRLFGIVGPQRSLDVRSPPNLGERPPRRGGGEP